MRPVFVPLIMMGLVCLLCLPASASDEPAEGWSVGGSYSARANLYHDFFASGGFDEDVSGAQLWTHALRLKPTFKHSEKTKLSLELTGLRDVLWGDNMSYASTSVFAGVPSVTDLTGRDAPSMKLQRAWIEFEVPAGLVKVGRMPSHWGLGLLSNHGNGFDDLFGQNHGGSTYDRFLFATRPLAIAEKVMGREDSETPLYFAIAIDRLVDDPLNQYYGFCVEGLEAGDTGFRGRCDADGDGVTESHEAVEETREAGTRGDDWWADGNDDVTELVYVLIYRGEDLTLWGHHGALTTGAYVVQRSQAETNSDVLIADFYWHSKFAGLTLDFEAVKISGQTRALPIPNTASSTDPFMRDANMLGYVVRAGYELNSLEFWLEHGFASGDDYLFDDEFTGRALNADFNVGLLLYEEVLARASYNNSLSPSLGSKGGVYNSRYIFPNVRYHINDTLEVIGAFLMVWPDQVDGDVYRCAASDSGPVCAELVEREAGKENPDLATETGLGWELDLALRAHWSEHMFFSLESGFAQVSDRVRLEDLGLNPKGTLMTTQFRFTYQL